MPTENAKDPNAEVNPMEYGTHCFDSQYMDKYSRALALTKMNENYRRRPRFFQLLEMLRLTRGLSGALLEAGSYRGLASNLICQTLREEDPRFQGNQYFMVDSFEGLSEPVDEDGEFAMQRFNEGAFTRTSLEQCQETMADFPQVKFIKGWIPQAFEELPDQPYRFVHIDVDIFQPTLDCLEYFYPRMTIGGIVVVDDYGPSSQGNWPGCAKAVHQFCQGRDIPFAKLDTGNAVIVRRPMA